jgi:hypothetical protein
MSTRRELVQPGLGRDVASYVSTVRNNLGIEGELSGPPNPPQDLGHDPPAVRGNRGRFVLPVFGN